MVTGVLPLSDWVSLKRFTGSKFLGLMASPGSTTGGNDSEPGLVKST